MRLKIPSNQNNDQKRSQRTEQTADLPQIVLRDTKAQNQKSRGAQEQYRRKHDFRPFTVFHFSRHQLFSTSPLAHAAARRMTKK